MSPYRPSRRAVLRGSAVLAASAAAPAPPTPPRCPPSSPRPCAPPAQYTATASTGQVTLAPFHRTHRQRYTVYWRVVDAPVDAHSPFDEGAGATAADTSRSPRS